MKGERGGGRERETNGAVVAAQTHTARDDGREASDMDKKRFFGCGEWMKLTNSAAFATLGHYSLIPIFFWFSVFE